jgi:sensor histidine kinase YesM
MREKAIQLQDFKELALHFLFGGGVITFLFNWEGVQAGEYLRLLEIWAFNGTLWVAIGLGSGYIVRWLDQLMPWLQAPAKRAVVSLMVMLFYALTVAMVIMTIYAGVFYRVGPIRAMRDFGYSFPITVVIVTLVVGLFLHGRGFFLSWKKSFQEAEEHKRASLAAEYEALKNQVNPHFLFNSFNVLSSLVYKDADLSARFIDQLSKVYRYVLETRQQELVPLAQELDMLQAYLFLLEIRFGASLDIEMNLEAREQEAMIPLALQMLVENAIKHNVASKNRPLQLRIKRLGQQIEVSNILQPKQNDQNSLGVGLPNLQERYRYLSGESLTIIQDETFFVVRVPILKLNEA